MTDEAMQDSRSGITYRRKILVKATNAEPIASARATKSPEGPNGITKTERAGLKK